MPIQYRLDAVIPAVQGDLQRVITRVLQYATLRAEAVAKEGAPRDTGALARSITSEVQSLAARVYSPLQYAAVMEAGRRPGARMPPPAALAGWARRHGYQGSLFTLARAIGRRGIEGTFFMRAAQQTVERELPGLIQRAIREVGG
jgi:glycyl-tRNA synthetase beta subunit